MEIWIASTVGYVALLALGVQGMRRLYGTSGRCDVQSSTRVLQHGTAPQIPAHAATVWHDDGGDCIDGEVIA